MGKIIFLVIISFFVISIILIKKCKKNSTKKIDKYLNNITIDGINSLSGQDFEEFLYYLFLNLGFDVTKTKNSHDYGADLILRVNNIKIAVQSKLYFNHSVGTSSVQEVYSSTKYYGTQLGIVITNSKFTKNAVNLAKSTNILLWDKEMLNWLINLSGKEKKNFKYKLMYSVISIA